MSFISENIMTDLFGRKIMIEEKVNKVFSTNHEIFHGTISFESTKYEGDFIIVYLKECFLCRGSYFFFIFGKDYVQRKVVVNQQFLDARKVDIQDNPIVVLKHGKGKLTNDHDNQETDGIWEYDISNRSHTYYSKECPLVKKEGYTFYSDDEIV
jgi:hypothetical protein